MAWNVNLGFAVKIAEGGWAPLLIGTAAFIVMSTWVKGRMQLTAKRRDETLRRQFIHARALAFPSGHAQERTIGFLSFLNEYGPVLVERLDEELPLDLGRHWIVTI